MFYYVNQPHTRLLLLGWLQLNLNQKIIETDLGRRVLVVAVINVDASTVSANLDLTCHLEKTDQTWK